MCCVDLGLMCVVLCMSRPLKGTRAGMMVSTTLLGKGIVRVHFNVEDGATEERRVLNAHYQPNCYTNVISSGRWHDMGYVEDNWTETVMVRDTKEVVCHFPWLGFPRVNAERS